MKPRKLVTEITGHGVLRKQRSEIINTKYFTSHENTSYCGMFNTSPDQLSSISVKECLDQINAHMTEQRPLRPIFVVQIKKFLQQVKKNQREMRGDQENKRQSKESAFDQKFMMKSPYVVGRSLKKFRTGFADNQRKTLKKRKINFENGEVQIVTKSKKSSQKSQRKVTERTLQFKQQIESFNRQIKLFKGQFLSEMQDLKSYFNSQLQTIMQIGSKMLRNCVLGIKKHLIKKQSQYSQTIRDLQDRLKEREQRQRLLKDYLKQREAQLITCWTALSLRES